MTAAEVYQDETPILVHYYDSRKGNCGLVRIFREAYMALKKKGLIPRNAIYTTASNLLSATNGVVDITVPQVETTFRCCASIQPNTKSELRVYRVEYKHRDGA